MPPRRSATSRRSLAPSGAASRFSLWKTIAIAAPGNAASSGSSSRLSELAERAHLTGRRLLEPGGELEERALAGPGRPEDRNKLALLDRRSRPRSATVSAAPER